jgi:O-antigen biosynthesis protein WbqV
MADLTQTGNIRRSRLRRIKNFLVVAHDAAGSAAALVLAVALIERPAGALSFILSIAPAAALAAAASVAALAAVGVFSSLWRLASLFDFFAIFKSSALVAALIAGASALLPDLAESVGLSWQAAILFCVLQSAILISGRVAYRAYRLLLKRKLKELENIEAAVFVGTLKEFDAALRAAEQGLLKNLTIAGGLLPRGASDAKRVQGAPVFGDVGALETACAKLRLGGISVCAVLIAASFSERPEELRELQVAARRLGLQILRLQPVGLSPEAAAVPLNFADFFLRSEIRVDRERIDALVRDKSVLVTGGGGSIGGEIARRVLAHGARQLVVVDISEQALQAILADLQAETNGCRVVGYLADVRDRARMRRLMAQAAPDLVVHSAALKHVDLAERNWQEAIKTNVFGTLNVLACAAELNTPSLVNISTDKAVEPVGMLGLTKRCAETLVARMKAQQGRDFLSVRFGNVLGSSGSVVPIFLRQIAAGGPVTITDPAMKRYFMSIKEASELVLVSCALAARGAGEARETLQEKNATFLLDMGEPVRIVDLAEQLIAWCGWTPHQDVKIVYTGLRPGERLEEALVCADERALPSPVKGVFQLAAPAQSFDHVESALAGLGLALERDDKALALEHLRALVARRVDAAAVHAA